MIRIILLSYILLFSIAFLVGGYIKHNYMVETGCRKVMVAAIAEQIKIEPPKLMEREDDKQD